MKNPLTTAIIVLFSTSIMAQSFFVQVKPVGSKVWGYANESGEIIIPAKFKKCFYFSEGLAAVYENKNYLFLKPDGTMLNTKVNGFRLASASLFGLQGFSDGMVQIKLKDNWGYLNTKGELAIEAIYDEATLFRDGLAVVVKGTDFFILSKDGKESKINVPNIKKTSPFSEGLAVLSIMDGKKGFINTDGKLVIEAKFVSAGHFTNGMAWAKNDNKELGYIDKTGAWVIEPIFMAGKNFDKTSGLARVKYKDKWAYVTMKGEVIYVNDTDLWGDFYNGLAKGRKDDKLGFYDKTGNYVIEPQFESVRDFKNGFAAAKLNGKWGMINTTGEWVIQPKFIGIKDMELMP